MPSSRYDPACGPWPSRSRLRLALSMFVACTAAVSRAAPQDASRDMPDRDIVICPSPGPVEPGRTPEGMALHVSVDQATVTPRSSGPAANVTVTLENTTGRHMWLDFGIPCFLRFRVETPDGDPVSFAEEGYGCAMNTAHIHMRPDERITRTLPWSARDGRSRPLAPGAYAIVGTLARYFSGEKPGDIEGAASRPVAVEVLEAR